jgi:hypothetical protein
MAAYTAAQLKALTSIPAVSAWGDTKILAYQTTAEVILTACNLDVTVTGYGDAYASAVYLLFDWLVENPTGLKSSSIGKQSATYSADDLPANVRLVLAKALRGEDSALQGTHLVRKDIGLR